MNQELLESTLSSFLKAWEHKNIDAVVALLSGTFEYYETPLEDPLTTINQIRELWSPVPTFEAEITLTFNTLSIDDEFGLFRINGIYSHTHQKDKKITKLIEYSYYLRTIQAKLLNSCSGENRKILD